MNYASSLDNVNVCRLIISMKKMGDKSLEMNASHLAQSAASYLLNSLSSERGLNPLQKFYLCLKGVF